MLSGRLVPCSLLRGAVPPPAFAGRVVKAPLSAADVGLIVDLLERLRCGPQSCCQCMCGTSGGPKIGAASKHMAHGTRHVCMCRINDPLTRLRHGPQRDGMPAAAGCHVFRGVRDMPAWHAGHRVMWRSLSRPALSCPAGRTRCMRQGTCQTLMARTAPACRHVPQLLGQS